MDAVHPHKSRCQSSMKRSSNVWWRGTIGFRPTPIRRTRCGIFGATHVSNSSVLLRIRQQAPGASGPMTMRGRVLFVPETERPPRGGLSKIRSGVLIRLREQRSSASCAVQAELTRPGRWRKAGERLGGAQQIHSRTLA
jgi:hypothetical protein